MSTKKTSVRAGAGSSLKTGYAAPTAAASNRSISTTRSRASDTNSAVSSASNSNTRNSGKRLNGFPPPTTASAPVPPPPPSASLADLAESEKLKINRLVEKLFEITAKYEETQNLLKSERDQHQLEINQVYEKINGQLLIIEDKMKLKDETIQSLTSKEAALTSLTVIYQRKLKALLDHDLPDYQQQVQSLKSTIDILQAEQSSLQNISKNDKQLINRLEKEIIDKNQQLSDYQHHQIPLLEESLKQEKLKNHKQDEKLQELNMKNRFYHTEIKQLQVKIQQLNDAIYHQEMSGTPPRPNNSNSRHHTAHQTSSNGRRSERRYDNNEDDSDNMMSPPNYRTSSSRKDDNRSSSDHRHQRSSRATSSSRSRSPSPITPNPPTKTKASPAIKKDLKKGSEDYSLMFQSVNSDDLEHYVRTKHLKDEEEDEEDDDDREERGGKGSNGNGKVNFDAIFDTSDPYIEQPVNQKRDLEDDDDEEDGGYDEDIKPYQGKDSLRKGNEISKSLDSADWRKRSSREEEGKRSSRSDGTIVSHLPFRKSRSADSSPDNRPRPSLVNGERKRRTSDIFFGNDNDDGDDSFTFTANKRAHTMSSSGGIAGIAVLDDDPIVNGTNNGSDKKREKDSLNDTSLFFDNSLNLSTSNISSLHVSPVTPATALKEEQKRRLKESPDVEDEDDEEDDVGAKYYRLTKSAEKAKREEEKRKEEEVVSAFEEQRERARKSRLEREFLAAREKLNKRVPSIIKTEDIVQLKKEVEANNNNNGNNRDDDDNDDDDSIKKRIAVLSPIDSFNKTFTSAFTSSQRNGLEKKMSEKEIKNDEIDEDQPVSTTAGSKKYSLLSSYKSDEGKELQKKLSKRNVSSDERRVRASQDEVEEEDTELQGILDSSISNKKKKKKILKSSSEIGVEDVILNEKPKKSDSMMKKKTSFHSLDSEVLPYEMIMGEKEVKEKKSKIKSLKSTDSHDTNKVATTTKSGKKSSKLKSKTEDTAETNITAKTSASKKKTSSSEATPVISNTATNPSVTITATPNPTKTKKSSTNKKSPKTDSIYNASLFDLLEEM